MSNAIELCQPCIENIQNFSVPELIGLGAFCIITLVFSFTKANIPSGIKKTKDAIKSTAKDDN